MTRHSLIPLFFVVLILLGASGTAAEVVIHEIMYHPLSDLDEDEFVELYNTGPTIVALQGWCFQGIDFCFPAGSVVGSGQYVVLAKDAARFQTTYGFPPDHVYAAKLNNAGERIALFNSFSQLVDEVSYADLPPWPVTPDGLGPSLELIDPLEENDTPRNWRACTDPAGQTAGTANSVAASGLPPWISAVTPTQDAQPGVPLIVTAAVADASTVELFYKIDFAPEVTVAMLDDGASNDGAAGDGVYGAEIPGQPVTTLVRYRIEASGATGIMRLPRSDDTITYDGTVVLDPALTSAVPIFRWYMDPVDYQAAIDHRYTNETEPAVLFYDGLLYDNMQVRVRGQSARSWPKKHWKFKFPQGHKFFSAGLIEAPVDNFDMQSSYGDKSWMREILSYGSFADAGAVEHQTFHVRLQQNGQFYGLYVFLEDPDRDWAIRNGLDENGARYKAYDDMRDRGSVGGITGRYEKHSRLYEDHSDLYALIWGINNLSGPARRDFLFDNVDLPSAINYIAVKSVIHDNDQVAKNYWIYRDSEGTRRWTLHPWDHDLTFGRNYNSGGVLNDTIWADVDVISGRNNVSPSHPLFGDSEHQKYDYLWNRLIDKLLEEPEIRQMYHRRLRSVTDQLLAPGRYEAMVDALYPLIETEAEMDRQKWGWYRADQNLQTAVDILKDQYLTVRRTHLLNTHRVPGELPEAQSSRPPILINELMYNPVGGADHEFVELYNPSATEDVDLSGWRLSGVGLTIPAGTVLLPQSFLVLVKNDVAFRTEYGGSKFVAAEYSGALASEGETIALLDADGNQISAVAYSDLPPWPSSPDGTGPSLELIDATQSNGWVGNWSASSLSGGTPGAPNSVAGSVEPFPELFINEVLPVNVSIHQDEQNDFDPWIEIYNGSPATADLGGMTLTDSFASPAQWTIPPSTSLCSGCWLLIWADGETGEGPLHANFTLNPLGGDVALYSASGTLLDYLSYESLVSNTSYGRYPDGSSATRPFTSVTPEQANDAAAVRLILNEYNAVSPVNFLESGRSDTYWGRIPGNGGDWFELVVTEDQLDIRGWELIVRNDTGGAGESSVSLLFSNDPIWSDLRGGTIITVAEDLADDVSYAPMLGDWWIHVQASDGASGAYITAQDFEVSNSDWQLTVRDDLADVVFGPAGEGIYPVSGIGSDEVCKLEEDPSPFITPHAAYNDGSSSTFGAPNIYAGGTYEQDFDTVRCGGADCAALGGLCGIGYCDTATGQCAIEPRFEGVGCDDGNPCTENDVCTAGQCTGATRDCTPFDDACNVGVCNPNDGLCEAQPFNEGLACDDGDACTADDACSAGACVPEGPLDCDDLNSCTLDSCDFLTGCVNTIDDGASCDDLNSCTTGDTCDGAGQCVGTTLGDGSTCDDGDLCTATDLCSGGLCAGTAVDCSTLDDACNVGTCNPGDGSCQAVPVTDGTLCDDGDLCTETDVCATGVCGGTTVDCSALDQPCYVGTCNGTSGECEAQQLIDGSSCDDGDLCTESDECAAGICAGSAKDCAGLDDTCNVGACNGTTGDCEAQPINEGGGCDDGVNCTENDQCAAGVCVGTALDCLSFDDDCNAGVCDEPGGTCQAQPLDDGTPCDDGDACTADDACGAGVCVAGGATDCDDDNGCTVDSCDSQTGCVQTPDPGAVCDDANGCTETDLCDAAGLCAGTPVADGVGCDDGDLCSELDQCSGGVCGGSPVDCSGAADACNAGVCNPASGACEARSVIDGTPCDDLDACTLTDSCASGACGGSDPVDCSYLDDDCNSGTCDSGTGVCSAQPINDGGACQDGDLCTFGESCTGGLCGDSQPVNCDDGVGCTEDSCDPGSGCSNAPNHAVCDDASVCNGVEACDPTLGCILCPGGDAVQAIELVDASGGGGVPLEFPDGIAEDGAGNVYVAGSGLGLSDSVLRIDASGGITPVLGVADGLSLPVGIDVDSAGNVYVAGHLSNNVFRIEPGGAVSVVLDSAGDGSHPLSGPVAVVVDDADNLYVSGFFSDNVFKVTPAAVISELIGPAGDGASPLIGPKGIAIDTSGNVFVAGRDSDNLFEITPLGAITELLDAAGDGTNALAGPEGVAVDAAGNVYVAGGGSDNVFSIAPGGPITMVIDAAGDGAGNVLDDPTCIGSDDDGQVYVAGFSSHNAFKIWNDGRISKVLDVVGDGTHSFFGPADDCLEVGASGRVYLVGTLSQNVFRTEIRCAAGLDCDDANACTDDSCDPLSGCQWANNAGPCDDGDPCSLDDTCAAGVCGGGTPLDCSGLDDTCNAGVCNAGTGICEPQPVNEGGVCEDGDLCTIGETCTGGSCLGALPVDCDDVNACTIDSCALGLCEYASSGACGVGGTIRYYRDNVGALEPSSKAVSGVEIDIDGDLAVDATTDVTGSYGVADLFGTLSVSALNKWGDPRAADHNGAITSFDAAFIAQYATQQLVLSANQEIAADVSGNGAVTSFDAARVAQFAVQVIDHFGAASNAGSDWNYLRCDNYVDASNQDCVSPLFGHDPLDQPETDDFYAVLYGDVTGNWAGAGGKAPASAEDQAAARDAKAAQRLSSIGARKSRRPAGAGPALARLTGWTGPAPAGTQRRLVLQLGNADGIEALDLELEYDPARIRVTEIEAIGLGDRLNLVAHDLGGRVLVGMYGVLPLEGSGELLAISVELVDDVGRAVPLSIRGSANEGGVPLHGLALPRPRQHGALPRAR